MAQHQHGILEPVPAAARYMSFRLVPDKDPRPCLSRLSELDLSAGLVVGLGRTLVERLGGEVVGLREAASLVGPGVSVPSNPMALWCWLRGEDPGSLLHRGRALISTVGASFAIEETLDAFRFEGGRDLTGYEDGTENPIGERMHGVALVAGSGPGLDGSSFVAVQRWQHDFARFGAMSQEEQDNAIGRRRVDNEELEDAPPSAHVKRTAQEDFDPEAFVLRRSMPWSDSRGGGLQFVAFGCSFDAFEAQMRRMVGLDDGVTDALFRFTRPLSSSHYWCPPTRDGHLDLSLLGL